MNIKSKKLRGFTLIEMLIALALFSVIMLCAFKIYEPVSNMFRSANISERSYSYTNNIETIVKGQLEAADNVWIYTGDHDDSDLAEICDMFKRNYYNNMVVGTAAHDQSSAIGTMHIMHIMNNADASFPSGQITVREFDFDCDSSVNVDDGDVSAAAPISILPDAYFNTNDANRYRFNYCLGTGTLRSVTPPSGAHASDIYQALDIHINGVDSSADEVEMNSRNLSMTVMVTGGGEISDENSDYRSFESPCSVASIGLSLPTLNSSMRGHQARTVYYLDGTDVKMDRGNISIQDSVLFNRSDIVSSVDDPAIVPSNFNDDIYFIYTYEEEFRAS